MKRFQKAVLSFVLVFSISQPSRASLGLAFGGTPAVVVGVAAMGVAAGGAYGSFRLFKSGKPFLGALAAVGSLAVGFFGFALMDGTQNAEFGELSPEGAEKLGITKAEMEIYNSEVEQVNAIAREIGSELKRQNSESPELARDMWMELGTQLSGETMKTVIAIAQQL